jgi:hypothetical protein
MEVQSESFRIEYSLSQLSLPFPYRPYIDHYYLFQ